jgi:hypothetical protein
MGRGEGRSRACQTILSRGLSHRCLEPRQPAPSHQRRRQRGGRLGRIAEREAGHADRANGARTARRTESRRLVARLGRRRPAHPSLGIAESSVAPADRPLHPKGFLYYPRWGIKAIAGYAPARWGRCTGKRDPGRAFSRTKDGGEPPVAWALGPCHQHSGAAQHRAKRTRRQVKWHGNVYRRTLVPVQATWYPHAQAAARVCKASDQPRPGRMSRARQSGIFGRATIADVFEALYNRTTCACGRSRRGRPTAAGYGR